MPFQKDSKIKNNNHNKKNNSLHNLHNISAPNDKKSIKAERVSSFISKNASLTVEAALVLPIFLFAMCFMMYFTEVIRIQAEVGNELYKQSKTLASYGYIYKKAESKEIIKSGKIEGLVTGALSDLYIKSQVKKELGDNYFEINNIESGISLILSTYMQEDDMIDVIAIYKIKIPTNFFQLNKIPVLQRARIRAWTGYEESSEGDTKEEIVYITKTGSVYHKDISCTHINLSVKQVNSSEIKGLRNTGGGKYYECELCGDEPSKKELYITDTGDRYHKRKDCSGITRGVLAVSISKVEGRGPCSRCAK